MCASIVDPHGDHLSDAVPKLRALADYAEMFGDRYARIESVAKGTGEAMRSLDLLNPTIRDAIRNSLSTTATALYDSGSAIDYR